MIILKTKYPTSYLRFKDGVLEQAISIDLSYDDEFWGCRKLLHREFEWVPVPTFPDHVEPVSGQPIGELWEPDKNEE